MPLVVFRADELGQNLPALGRVRIASCDRAAYALRLGNVSGCERFPDSGEAAFAAKFGCRLRFGVLDHATPKSEERPRLIKAKPLCLAIGKFDANRRLRTVYTVFRPQRTARRKDVTRRARAPVLHDKRSVMRASIRPANAMPTTHSPNGVRCRILHVTQNEADHRLLCEVVRGRQELAITHAPSGEDALSILDNPPNADAQPNVVFLSWFLPGTMSGEEVLRRMKSSGNILAAQDEIRHIYALGASCVMSKPISLSEFDANMRTFASFWGHVAVLPFCRQEL
jgi:CheY-like chemotaxis protein